MVENVVVELADALEDSVVWVLGNMVDAAVFVRLVAVVVSMVLNSFVTIEIVPCSSSPRGGGDHFSPNRRVGVGIDHA